MCIRDRAHTQPAVPAADSVSGTPDAPARTGYVPGPDTLRAETAFAGTNFANPAFADGSSAPFSVAATGAAPSEWRDTTSAAIFGAQSTLAEPARIPLAPPPPLAENAVFQSFVPVSYTHLGSKVKVTVEHLDGTQQTAAIRRERIAIPGVPYA